MSESIAPDALAELQASFLESLPLIEGHAHKRFHHLHGPDRDEAVAEVVAIAWKAYRHLFIQGRDIEEVRGAIAVFAGKSVGSGARLVGQHPVRDVMSPTAKRGHCLGNPREDEWTDDDSPADQAVLDVDVQEWLATLDDRRREIAESLMAGFNTADVGRQRGVTRAAIHNARKILIESWEEFFGADAYD